MRKPTVEDVLKEGMYGPKEIMPEERRRFLGTLRERIIIALRKIQVNELEVYPEIEQAMKENPAAHLFLNGNIHYEKLSKYIRIAKQNKISHTIVTNKEYDSDIGLVLAMSYAIEKEDIYVSKTVSQPKQKKKKSRKKRSILKKLFKWLP